MASPVRESSLRRRIFFSSSSSSVASCSPTASSRQESKSSREGWEPDKKAGNQIARALAFPLLAGKTCRIDKGAIGFVAIQETFLEEAIESGHHGGVSERTAQLGDDVAHVAFAARPENFH